MGGVTSTSTLELFGRFLSVGGFKNNSSEKNLEEHQLFLPQIDMKVLVVVTLREAGDDISAVLSSYPFSTF